MRYKHFTKHEEEIIIDLYVIENKSSQKIADLFGKSRAGIIKVLKRNNILIKKVGGQLGHKTSQVTRDKIGNSNRGRVYSDEQKIKMSYARREGENPKMFLQHGYLTYKLFGKRIILHRKIWEDYYNRIIPNNCVIHHIDGNKLNNKIGNLQLLSRSEHSKLHTEQGDFCIGVNNGY